MPRPKASLDTIAVPKDGQPAANLGPAVQPQKNYAHTLSLRLTAEQYRRLRRYVTGQEEQTGGRMTHQALIEAALDEYLTARSA